MFILYLLFKKTVSLSVSVSPLDILTIFNYQHTTIVDRRGVGEGTLRQTLAGIQSNIQAHTGVGQKVMPTLL